MAINVNTNAFAQSEDQGSNPNISCDPINGNPMQEKCGGMTCHAAPA
jgi:hypothetical protein